MTLDLVVSKRRNFLKIDFKFKCFKYFTVFSVILCLYYLTVADDFLGSDAVMLLED